MPRKTPSGFTLIELLITLAVLGVLLSVGVPTFRVWIQNAQVRNSADALLNGIQLARTEAVRRNLNVEFALGTSTNWTVQQASPRAVVQTRVAEEGMTNKTQIDKQPADAGTVTFSPLGGVTNNLDGSSSMRQIDITAPGAPAGVRRLSIVISINGSPRMCDRDLPSTDIRAC